MTDVMMTDVMMTDAKYNYTGKYHCKSLMTDVMMTDAKYNYEDVPEQHSRVDMY